ncbi:MAG: hypothetical protein Q4E12_00635 [Coriobacteriia bacterium]|nr:hypothetical protein [Coriobacteriia bacterium]
MKTCPTCNATCFDDMPVCYGCLHSFADEDAAPEGATTAAGLPKLPENTASVLPPCTLPEEESAVMGAHAAREKSPSRTLSVPAITVVPEKGAHAHKLATREQGLALNQEGNWVLTVQVPKNMGTFTIRCENPALAG